MGIAFWQYIVKMRYMKARLLVQTKEIRDNGTIIEIVIWLVPRPIPPCSHSFKYSLFYGRPGTRLVGYDNERGKGDHLHRNGNEEPYAFSTPEQLLEDFAADVVAMERSGS